MLTLELAEDIIQDRGLGEGSSEKEVIEAYAYIFRIKRVGYLSKTYQKNIN